MDQNQKSIGDAIKDYLNRSSIRPKLDAIDIKDCWAEIVGELISKKTDELLVHNKTLVVYISSAPIKSELMFEKEALLKRLNQKLGKEMIEEIIIK
ncbi:MAG: DUF721 domain-containing protein [Bacteroidia bacterium]|nr:DUF721 domain-containing protein [Bacteroidia bacterium]